MWGSGPTYTSPMSEIRLQGERVLIRAWQQGDIPALLEHGNDPEVARNMVDAFPHPYGQQDAENWLQVVAKAPFLDCHFGIEFEGEAVGGVGYTPAGDVARRCAEIGYWIGQAHWGKGIATEALGLLTDHVFAHTDIVRLRGTVFEWNPASARVLEKCGYELEARCRQSAYKLGQVIDTFVYVRLKPLDEPTQG